MINLSTKPPYLKYIVFCYESYYPCGGINDIKGSVDTTPEVQELLNKVGYCENLEIVDRDTWEVVG